MASVGLCCPPLFFTILHSASQMPPASLTLPNHISMAPAPEQCSCSGLHSLGFTPLSRNPTPLKDTQYIYIALRVTFVLGTVLWKVTEPSSASDSWGALQGHLGIPCRRPGWNAILGLASQGGPSGVVCPTGGGSLLTVIYLPVVHRYGCYLSADDCPQHRPCFPPPPCFL